VKLTTNLVLALFSLVAGPLGLLGAPSGAFAAQPAGYQGTIVAAGDSLTAGYGLPESDAYPAQLERKLRQNGLPWKVVNAGISGETSAGLLSRVDWLLRLKPDIVIVETGANDGLRGIDPKVTYNNLDQAVTRLKARGVTVVLAGMRMLSNLGDAYTKEFSQNYTRLAKKHKLILIPFFLQGVAGDPSLNQQDGIHPVAKGYRIVTDAVYPYVVKAIDQRKNKPQH